MRIWTSNYAKANRLSASNYAFVRLSSSRPEWFNQPLLPIPQLYPSWEIIDAFKNGRITWAQYVEAYNEQLYGISISEVSNVILNYMLSHNLNNAILLCWCKETDPCHRKLVAKWLSDYMDIQIREM